MAKQPLLRGKKVYVGMSGGVDSSVSAALLKQAGYDVTGVFIRVWDPSDEIKGVKCSWRDERREAMRVAAVLDIPFETWDFSREYKRAVVDYMIKEYRAGRTPNPDVMCNKEIKFGIFYKTAIKKGADFVATGHYCQIQKAKNNDNYLKISNDLNKDQSYFLWNLKPEQLPHIILPIGHLTKPEVRELAAKFRLPNADKKDSQGLCFVGQFDFKKFLKNKIKPKIGSVVNEQSEKIGMHDGVWFYTIGERHGFTITKKTPNDRPYYIIDKDIKKNLLIVSTEPDRAIKDGKEVLITKINWIGKKPDNLKTYKGRLRYRQPLQSCRIKILSETEANVIFARKQTTITPGQSVVIYMGKNCLGGGIIK